ncbi:glucose-1-phosphate adenylyltransferase [Parapedobacter sp.]
MANEVISVVLGGGKGTRLHPLTENRSKPAVPLAGKYRLVDIPISNCLNSGLDRIFVLTQHNSASLNSHIKNTYNFPSFNNAFVEILAAEQTNDGREWFSGNADAVRHLHRYLAHLEFEYVLVLSGDQLYQMDLGEMIESHRHSHAQVTVATIPVAATDASSFGILRADKAGKITSFIEKPPAEALAGWVSDVADNLRKEGRYYLASMGIYLFNRETLAQLLTEPCADFGKELIPKAILKHHVNSFLYDGYWTDIGNISSFFEANIGLTDDLPQFDLFNKNGVYTRARHLPPSKIGGTYLRNAIIADGCMIAAEQIVRSVIGIRSRIGTGVTIHDTYMMGADGYQTLTEMEHLADQGLPFIGIGENCHIERAILDKNCAIGDNVRIIGGAHLENGDFGTYGIVDGIVVVKKWAVLPSGTTIG